MSLIKHIGGKNSGLEYTDPQDPAVPVFTGSTADEFFDYACAQPTVQQAIDALEKTCHERDGKGIWDKKSEAAEALASVGALAALTEEILKSRMQQWWHEGVAQSFQERLRAEQLSSLRAGRA